MKRLAMLSLLLATPANAEVASFYTVSEQGRATASGIPLDDAKFTCAHKSLKFGTRLRLTRAGKTVDCIVTDRGPFIAGRDLDLSVATAKALGITAAVGVARVTVRVIA